MALYRVLVLGEYATVRHADDGITDVEWAAGVRNAIPSLSHSKYELEAQVPWEVTVISNEEWNLMFKDEQAEAPASSKWNAPVDKWDVRRKVY
jgi:hypothetical protein